MIRREDTVLRWALGIGLAIGALNAFAGGVYGLTGAPGVPVSLLEDSPFRDYTVPSAFLFAVVGGSMAVAAAMLLGRLAGARMATFAAGSILVAWILAQVSIIGWISWLQPLCLGMGVLVIAMARFVPSGFGLG